VKHAHVLEPTKGDRRPRRLIFFDTETRMEFRSDWRTIHKLRVGVAQFHTYDPIDGWSFRKELVFRSPGEFWSWVDAGCKPKSTTYIVAHNIVFDLSVTGGFKRLAELGWELGSWYQKGMVGIFRWRKGERRLVGLDNGNFFGGKLEKWGERLGLPKLEVDFRTVEDDELIVYCRRDVEIMVRLWQTWLRFLDDHGCGSFKPTVSSTAFNTWRRRFLRERVHIHTDELATEIEREAYKGGRTECLWLGYSADGPYYYLDVNNMYGYVLSTFEYPAGLWNSVERGDPYNLAYKLERHAVIARVLVEVDEPVYPFELFGHVCYPVGSYWTTLTTPELELAWRRGWIRDVGPMAWYRKARLFDEYVREFYELRRRYRREGNEGFAQICKLLINGLYGKFGQKGLIQEVIGDCDPSIVRREEVFCPETGEIWDQVWLGGKIFRERREGEAYHSFPGIAAHVTAYARMVLWELARSVPKRHLYYMDTDSLIVDRVGYEALKPFVQPDRLGALKVELESSTLEINAPKDYRMDRRIRQKGISSQAVEVRNGAWMQEHWPKLPGLIRAGVSEGYYTQMTVRSRSGRFHQGVVRPDGWVEPFVLEEGSPFGSPVQEPAPVLFV